ncbi:MAG: hypothetical protein JW953_15935 [Anaerolineae bacterium]|nr:hypothetical protein [Anaerolineae bacterium]
MIVFLKKHHRLLLIICSLLIFGLTYLATVETKNGDFTYSLLVSQAILEHQTIQLDAYKNKIDGNRHFDHDYRIEKVNGHYYYFLPLAPSVLSTPIVWGANFMRQDMTVQEQEYELLKLMAAVSCVLIFLILYALGRCYLDPLSSLVIALVSVLGTNLVSSLGMALSSMNFAVIFITLSLLLIARYDTGQAKRINSYWLGLFLFLAFWSRPTAAPFILMVFVYIFARHRAIFLKLVIASLIPFLLFLGWSWLTYGQLLPTFSSPDKLLSTSTFWVALYGNAFSPARGLFIFWPFFGLMVIGGGWFFHDLKRNDLFWFSLAWFGLYYILISRYPHWWDGHNFGPRILTDGLPALILLTILLWREILQRTSAKVKIIFAGGYMTLGVVAVFINVYQGLYNPYTYLWLKNPNIDRYPEYLFNWKYPQFLASEESLRQRSLEHQQKRLNTYALGDTITYESSDAVFWNWYEPEIGWRWSQGTSAGIVFKLASGTIVPGRQYVIEILAGVAEAQKIGVTLNDRKLGELELEAFAGDVPETQTLIFKGMLLQENSLNKVDFYIPNVAITENQEARTAGMAFVSLKIYPFTSDNQGVHYFDSEFFQAGFSDAEQEWRWTDGPEAVLVYPLEVVDPNREYVMEIISGALGVQEVKIILNGADIGSLTFAGTAPETHGLSFEGSLLKEHNNRIHFFIPNATVPKGDSRQLGLAFVALKINPVE